MVYGAYALGMGLVVLVLTLSAAFANSSVATNLREFSRVVPRIGGALMVLAGAYAIWYGRWELAVYDGQLEGDPIIDHIEGLRLQLVREVQRVGPLGLVGLASIIVVGLAIRSRHRGSIGVLSQRRSQSVPADHIEADMR